MYEFKAGDECLFRFSEKWDKEYCQWEWSLVRVRVERVTRNRATIRLTDFPQFRARNVSVSKLVL